MPPDSVSEGTQYGNAGCPGRTHYFEAAQHCTHPHPPPYSTACYDANIHTVDMLDLQKDTKSKTCCCATCLKNTISYTVPYVRSVQTRKWTQMVQQWYFCRTVAFKHQPLDREQRLPLCSQGICSSDSAVFHCHQYSTVPEAFPVVAYYNLQHTVYQRIFLLVDRDCCKPSCGRSNLASTPATVSGCRRRTVTAAGFIASACDSAISICAASLLFHVINDGPSEF